MKPIRLVVCLVLWIVCAFGFAQSYDNYPYVIDDFKVDLNLKSDGWMDVAETIQVHFNDSRHGIYRTIPVVYDNGKGFTRRVLMTGISANDEQGIDPGTLVKGDGNNVKIRLGDKDTLLPPGTQKTYTIHYSVYGMLNWFDHDSTWNPWVELYWNITGDEWDTVIKRTSYAIHYPEPKSANKGGSANDIRTRMFVGPLGSTLQQLITGPVSNDYGQETEFTLSENNKELTGERLTPLPPYNGATVVLSLPADTIPKPPLMASIWLAMLGNLGLMNPLMVIPVLFLFWIKFGRDPKGGPMVVQFEPPEGLGAAECGTITDERVDQRDIAAGIISMAQKGFLRIEVSETSVTLFKSTVVTLHVLNGGDASKLTAFEAELLWRFKKCGDVVTETDLRTDIAPNITAIKNVIYQDLVEKGYYVANPNSVRQAWIIVGLICTIGLAVLLHNIGFAFSPAPAIVGAIVSAIAVVLFGLQMPKRTEGGSRVRQKVVGFEEFIRRARKNELEWMQKRAPDQMLFEEYLPYAIAFGLGREWAETFKSVEIQNPNWYVSPYGGPFNVIYFTDSLSSATNSVASAASTPPRSSGASGGSSGFGGGGFSGGGFGGGGGGSW